MKQMGLHMKLATLQKALKIIDLFTQHPQRPNHSRLSHIVGFSKSATYHTFRIFMPLDYVAREQEAKKYSLDFKLSSSGKVLLCEPSREQIGAIYPKECYRLR